MRFKCRHGIILLTIAATIFVFCSLPPAKERLDGIAIRQPNSRLFAKLHISISKSEPCITVKKDNLSQTTNALSFRNVMITQNNATLAAAQELSSGKWTFHRGFMKVLCPVFNFTSDFISQASKHHKSLLSTMPVVYTNGTKQYLTKSIESWTTLESVVFVVREEYANPYWVLIDLIDLYLTLNQSGVDPKKTTVIWGDNHTSSVADQLWDAVFKAHLQVSPLAKRQLIFAKQLTLRPDRKHSIVLRKEFDMLPPVYGFRHLVYSNLGLMPNQFSCDAIRVLVVWRRDYVNHPGNPDGRIDRKVDNEAEVVATMRSVPFVLVTEVQLDRLSAVEQIRLMSETDVFWGVHGAGHAMSLFLPSDRVVVELMPSDKAANWHMGHLSKLSGHKHITGVVKRSHKVSDNTYYTVSSSTVKETLEDARSYLCD